MKEKDIVKEINQHLRESLNRWADIALDMEAKQWAYMMKYYPRDLMNVTYLFQHVESNIGIKAGLIDEERAVEFGERLRQLILDMTGHDTHDLLLPANPTAYELRAQFEVVLDLMSSYGANRSLGNVGDNILAKLKAIENREAQA